MNNKIYLLAATLTLPLYALTASATSASKPDTIVISEVTEPADTPLQDLITSAISRFEQTRREQWSYRIERYENEEGDISSRTEQHDAALPLPQRWSLIEVNGKTPTPRQQKQFRDKKVNKESKGQGISLKLRELIHMDTLQILAQTADTLTAGFDVYLDDLGKESSESLEGKLYYDKSEAYISRIEITNRDTFSPVFSASITHLKMNLYFQKIDQAILPIEKTLAMKGTFAIFTKIEELSSDKYSDFRFVGE